MYCIKKKSVKFLLDVKKIVELNAGGKFYEK